MFNSVLMNLYHKVKFALFRRKRAKWVRQDLKSKIPCSKCLPNEILSDIKLFWHQRLHVSDGMFDSKWFEIYNAVETDKSLLKYYIPDDFFYCYVDPFFNNPRATDFIDDKNLYDLLFTGVRQPHTVVRKMNGLLLDSSYRILSIGEAVQLCKQLGNVIIKKSCFSSGGKGVSFWTESESTNVLIEFLKEDDVIIQEIIEQHEDVAKIHPSSVNTIRIMTLLYNNKVSILSSVFRMGCNNSKVDNASSGGIVAGILEDGRLKNYAYNTKAVRFDSHPQGMLFQDVIIPNFKECIEMVTKIAPRFSSFSKLISWDLAIGKDGSPILIEANLSFGEIDFHQLNNGPIFGSMTEDIINYVIKNYN